MPTTHNATAPWRRTGLVAGVATLLLVGTLLGGSPTAKADLAPGSAEDRSARRPAKTLDMTWVDRPATIVSGTTVAFAGTAPKSLRRTRVTLLRRVGKAGEWVDVDTARISRTGTFKLSGPATGVGLVSWRAVARHQRSTHVSNIKGSTVFAWYYAADLEPVDYDDWDRNDSISVGGQRYLKSVGLSGWDESGWGEYNLSYRCVTFEAYIGMSDESESGAAAEFSATLDGARTGLGAQGLGPATRVALDVSSRLRIRLDGNLTTPDGEPFGYPVFGNARFLCSGRP